MTSSSVLGDLQLQIFFFFNFFFFPFCPSLISIKAGLVIIYHIHFYSPGYSSPALTHSYLLFLCIPPMFNLLSPHASSAAESFNFSSDSSPCLLDRWSPVLENMPGALPRSHRLFWPIQTGFTLYHLLYTNYSEGLGPLPPNFSAARRLAQTIPPLILLQHCIAVQL